MILSVNALRSPVYPEMINIISDLPVTFSGYKFEEDNVKNIMNGYVFTNGRPITKSILAWWAYTDQNQELISLDTNLEIEHIYSKKRQENVTGRSEIIFIISGYKFRNRTYLFKETTGKWKLFKKKE